jgi:hypothetical protein
MAQAQTYGELVRALPRPASTQVEAFVEHVAGADNWLKLLPLGGGPDLVVFLDPNAGARVNRVQASGRYFVELLTPASELVHGSELPTDEYRRRFGFLNYHLDAGGGTAAVEGHLLVRALLPEPGIVHAGALVPLPAALRATAGRPGAFLHATFRGGTGTGTVRRFRYAIERLGKLDGAPAEHPLIARIRAWIQHGKTQDDAGFRAWLQARGEQPDALDATARWQRYVEWRDDDACVRLHAAQDEEFDRSGIPTEVIAAHHAALDIVRGSVHTMLSALDAS